MISKNLNPIVILLLLFLYVEVRVPVPSRQIQPLLCRKYRIHSLMQ